MLHEFLLAVIISIDILLFAAAYRCSDIRIPLTSAAVIVTLSAAVLGFSLIFSEILNRFIPEEISKVAGLVVLVTVGVITVFKSILRTIVRRLSARGELSMKIGDGGMMIKLYLDDTAADLDCSKVLSAAEAFTLALASSVDAAAVGLCCGYSDISPLLSSAFALVTGSAAIVIGSFAGSRIAAMKHDLSWLGGAAIIAFAVFEFIS